MESQNIKDIASLRKIKEESEMFASFKKYWPLLKPIFKFMKGDIDSIEKKLQEIPDLVNKTREMIEIPDKFNNYFSSLGWIIYETMDFELAQKAILLAEKGDIPKAEDLLVEYYSPETVEKLLRYMVAVKAFDSRMNLAKLALEDYKNRRFYSTVLVILSILDGMVNEIFHHGFFSRVVEL